MSSNYYSQATANFTGSTQAYVDPRTGQFAFSMPLGTLIGNCNLGPSLPLAIQYAPMTSDNVQGIGIGCTLGLSNYDQEGKLLTLNTGEQYKTIEYPDSVTVNQKKLNSFVFIKQSSSEYHIVYKTGEVEVLTNKGLSPRTFKPTQILSPAGHSLFLTWQMNGNYCQLTMVQDETNTLCRISYDGKPTVSIWPGSDEAYSVTLTVTNNRLYYVTNNAETPSLTWSIDYDSVLIGAEKVPLATSITAPTGYQQHVTYAANVMAFPTSANLPPLPAVTNYTQRPGMGQPAITTTYSYSSKNYLGFDGVSSWTPDVDNLYSVLSDYEYTSTEMVLDKSSVPTMVTVRAYNSFHLMTSEKISQGKCSRLANTEYYAVAGATFDQQPNYYQCPMTQTVTWSNGDESRSEVTTSTYDSDGNLLAQIDPDTTLTEYEYNAAGSSGFVNLLKSKTVTPAKTEFNDESAYRTEYEYEDLYLGLIPPVGSIVTQCYVQTNEIHSSNGLVLSSRATEYVKDSTSGTLSSEFGRISRLTSVHYNAPDETYTSTVGFEFSRSGNSLVQCSSYSSHDGILYSVGRTQSCLSGRLFSTTDRLGNVTNYAYDNLGRLTEKTSNVGSLNYQRVVSTQYSMVTETDPVTQGVIVTDIVTTRTDEQGNSQRTHFDGLGRVLVCARNWVDSGQVDVWYETERKSYDEFGRVVVTESSDSLKSSEGNQTSLTVTNKYDDWNQKQLRIYSTQQQAYTDYNPCLRQTKTQLQVVDGSHVLGYFLETYKAQVVSDSDVMEFSSTNIAFDSSDTPQETTCSDFDALGRMRRQTIELTATSKATSSWDYDVFGRVVKQTLPDGNYILTQYDPSTSRNLVSSLKIVDVSASPYPVTYDLGLQKFDGLGRLISQSSGGRTQTLTYNKDNFSSSPNSTTDSQGIVINYGYIKELGNQLASLKSTGAAVQQDFAYGKTGELIEADESGGMKRSYSYTASGFLEQEVFTPVSGSALAADYTWSLQGALLSYTDVAGNLQTISLDKFGRTKSISDPAVSVSLSYDFAGRMYKQDATDTKTGQDMTTLLEFDDFGRETKRTLSTAKQAQVLLSVTQSYNLNGQLATRTATDSEGNILRDEQFVYDLCSRLVVYSVAGSQPPVDGYGQIISKQSFEYDVLNNITQCTTVIVGGESDVVSFSYSEIDPAQLSSLTRTNSSAPIVLSYDQNGRMTKDEAGRSLSYDVLGRLNTVVEQDSIVATYAYDALDMLISQRLSGNDIRQLYYRGTTLVNEINVPQGKQSRFVRLNNTCLGVSDDEL
ncbi:RHS repeat domain-containing protein [Pseudomonas sp. 22526]|uniref:RHS repeat domain-containing protein n=1 Tax=Pseudomonas sp. 22526 TaxID=3453937 RepID=UPI003F828D6F